MLWKRWQAVGGSTDQTSGPSCRADCHLLAVRCICQLLLGPVAAHRLGYMLRQKPGVVQIDPQSAAEKLDVLQDLLMTDRDKVGSANPRHNVITTLMSGVVACRATA